MADEPGTGAQYEFTLRYTKALINTATRRYFTKLIGWRYRFSCILLLACIVAFLALGDRDWFVGAASTLFVIACAFPALAWIVIRRRATRALRKMSDPFARIIIYDEGYTVTSDLGSGTIKWKAVHKIWCFPEV